MKTGYILTTIFIIYAASSARIVYADETLPENIYIKTLSRGFSYEYLYALKDGKIWIAPNKRNTGVGGEWSLFNGSGIPELKDAPSFKKGHVIREFSTEGTMIVAASDEGRLYFWQPTLEKNTRWSDMTGAPFEGALFLPPHRTWCFSLSLMRAPWKRLTPMHENDIVTYWEDIDGNKTEFGFTATIYAVDPDGQKIRYTDTGLPVSWHKAFSSPERGRFIIENISAAASAVFVVNRTGKMYTRMMDYELEGGCPGLRFTYERGKRTEGEKIAPLMESIRTLPLPDWREQEPVREVLEDTTGVAAITRNITIVLTGKGNAARELRVRGRNNKGEYGYWSKPIFGSAWTFVRTDEKFGEEEIVRDYMSETPKGAPLDKTYRGILKKTRAADIRVELVDFYYYSTPCILRVFTGDTHFDLIFHTVDLWSVTVQKKDYPELVGNPSGEPKLLQGTIEIPPEVLASENPDIRKTVDTYFKEFNLVPLAFKVYADDEKISIASRLIQRDIKTMNYEIRKLTYMELSNRDYRADEYNGFYSSRTQRPDLRIPSDVSQLRKKDIPEIDACITRNRKALNDLIDLLSRIRDEQLKAGLLSTFGSAAYYLFNGAVNLTGIPYWKNISNDPGTAENITQLGGVSYSGGTATNEYAVMNLKYAGRMPKDFKRAEKILNDRIDQLKKIRRAISRKK
jgi:hypothetical protein